MKYAVLRMALILAVTGAFLGCAEQDSGKKDSQSGSPGKKVPIGKNVSLEVQGDKRRVLVDAYVCLRQGQLEQFLTRKQTKEHEAILAADVDVRDIHTALLAAGAQDGKPVQFQPKYQPATGSVIKITLVYEDKGKKVEVPARNWVRNVRTKKALDQDWVFGGSITVPDPFDKAKKPVYMANEGDVICVSNFETAMLDLPIESSAVNEDLQFEAWTDRIPPVETPVQVILEPVIKKN